jgi:hypothetical protein
MILVTPQQLSLSVDKRKNGGLFPSKHQDKLLMRHPNCYGAKVTSG